MATYLQGVTDYIPDYQPFQPDLNFYGNVMQTKQTQYDTNWQSLNNLYGQLYGADLTHDLNIKKKDELLKQIDFNLKRVSGLDLSLEQNVTQAMQVFKPFYEDKYLMKDMAYTKNWKNTYNSANALKNSQDEKQRKQWWGTGIQGLELRRQMFKDSDLEGTLNMSNAQYTPFVNAVQEYMDLAKKFNVGSVSQLPDQSGLYLVRKKNGELILPTLQNMFLAEYANMILVSMLAALMFLGGWLSPIPFIPDSFLWLLIKVAFLLFCFIWFRATFPRYRYDQIMRLGWKIFIPITIAWIVFIGGMMQTSWGYLFH